MMSAQPIFAPRSGWGVGDSSMDDLGDALYSTPAMLALFSGEGHVRRMLDFEAALARAEARAGVIPSEGCWFTRA